MGEVDIEGTKKMVSEIYNSFTTFGSKSFLILNKVAGYCIPNTFIQGNGGSDNLSINRDLINNGNLDNDVSSLSMLLEENKQHPEHQLTETDSKKVSIDIKDGFSDAVGMKLYPQFHVIVIFNLVRRNS